MPQNITKTVNELISAAQATVPAMSAEEAMNLVDSPDHVFVDLRGPNEQVKRGRIPGAIASSRGLMEYHIDPDCPAHKPEFNQDKTFIFYCASGGRSAMAAVVAMDMGLTPVINLTGGTGAWKKAGGPLVKPN